MRKVFLEDLPKWGKCGKAKEGNVNWFESIGHKVPFVYDEIDGEVEIVDYKDKYLKLKYNGVVFDNKPIFIGNFIKAKISYYLNIKTINFKIGLSEKIVSNDRDLTITKREYRYRNKGRYIEKEKWYKYTCNKCGWNEGWIRESNLLKGQGCSCCCNPPQIVVPHINSIWIKAPWMIDLGVSEEDAKRYTPQSNKNVIVICPDCKKERKVNIYNIYKNKSISCSCGDGVSYPEKFMFNILNQLEVKFITQLSKTTFKWCDKYRYDFYIPSLNTIIETHGLQHYKESNRGRTLKEEQQNDRLKRELALENGIEHYIELDCSESDLEYIKNSILKSELNNLFNLSNVNFKEADLYSIKSNKIKEVCKYWNNEELAHTKIIADKMNIDKNTVVRMLKKGVKLGWCDYDTKEEENKRVKLLSKPVEIFDKYGDSMGVYSSMGELERQSEELFGVKLIKTGISAVCRNELSSYKGYTFEYADNN